jgi:hypothetical protein
MTMRTSYRNGNQITLNNCYGCNPCMINGVLCHETGCPEAWKDHKVDCPECGQAFYPEERQQAYCSPCCAAAYTGQECECDESQSLALIPEGSAGWCE